MSYRVLIADDHELMRSGVRQALESDGSFDVVAEVVDGAQAVSEARRLEPDLCLVDFYMPHGEAQMIRELTRLLPNSPVVVFTASTLDDDLFTAITAGAAGFVPKETAAGRLPSMLRGVLDGEAALPRRLTTKLIEEFRLRRRQPQEHNRSLSPFGDRLSQREVEVLELLAEGLATSQIAGTLGVCDVTVRRHIAAIVHKLGATGRPGVIRLAREAREPAA